MTDLTITATSVVGDGAGKRSFGTAGEAITAGQAVYLDATVNKWKLADSDSVTSGANKAGGIALNGAALNQPVTVQVEGDVTLEKTPLTTPVNSAFTTETTGGTLAAGTYYYRVSAINAAGETLASLETSQVTTGTTSTVTVNWGAVSGATGYKVFGRTAGAELLIATVGSVTTYTDTGSATPAGALPTVNTTGGSMIAGTAYYLSETPGGIQPAADLTTGENVCQLGIAKSTSVLAVKIVAPGVAV